MMVTKPPIVKPAPASPLPIVPLQSSQNLTSDSSNLASTAVPQEIRKLYGVETPNEDDFTKNLRLQLTKRLDEMNDIAQLKKFTYDEIMKLERERHNLSTEMGKLIQESKKILDLEPVHKEIQSLKGEIERRDKSYGDLRQREERLQQMEAELQRRQAELDEKKLRFEQSVSLFGLQPKGVQQGHLPSSDAQGGPHIPPVPVITQNDHPPTPKFNTLALVSLPPVVIPRGSSSQGQAAKPKAAENNESLLLQAHQDGGNHEDGRGSFQMQGMMSDNKKMADYIGKQKSRIKALEANIDSLKSEIEKKNSQIEDVNLRLRIATDLEKEHTAMKQETGDMRKTLSVLSEDLRNQSQRHSKMEEEHQNKLNELKHDNKLLAEKIIALDREKTKAVESLNFEMSSLANKLKQTELDRDNLKNQLENLANEHKHQLQQAENEKANLVEAVKKSAQDEIARVNLEKTEAVVKLANETLLLSSKLQGAEENLAKQQAQIVKTQPGANIEAQVPNQQSAQPLQTTGNNFVPQNSLGQSTRMEGQKVFSITQESPPQSQQLQQPLQQLQQGMNSSSPTAPTRDSHTKRTVPVNEQHLDILEDKLSRIQKDKDVLQSDYLSAIDQNKQLSAKLEDLSEKLKQASSEAESIPKLRSDNQQLAQALRKISSESVPPERFAAVQEELKKLNSKLQAANEEVEIKSNQLKRLEQDEREKDEKVLQLIATLNALTSKKQDLMSEVLDINRDLSEKDKQLEFERTRAKEEVKNLNFEIDRQRIENSKLNEKLSDYQGNLAKIAELQNQNKVLQTQKTQIAEELAAKIQANNVMQATVSDLQVQLSKLAQLAEANKAILSKNAQLEGLLADSENAKNQLKNELAYAKQQNDVNSESKDIYLKKIKESDDRATELKAESARLKESLNNKDIELSLMKNQISDLSNKNSALIKTQFVEHETSMVAEPKAIRLSEKPLIESTVPVQSVNSSRDAVPGYVPPMPVITMANPNDEALKKQLTSDNQVLQERLMHSEKSLNDLQTLNQNLRREYDAKLDQATNFINQRELEINDLKSKITSIQKANEESSRRLLEEADSKLKAEVAKLNSMLQEKDAQFSTMIESLKQNHEHDKQAAVKASCQSMFNELMAKFNRDREGFETKIKHLEEESLTKSQDNKKLAESLQELMPKYLREAQYKQRLLEQAAEKDKALQTFSDENTKFRSTIMDLQTKLEDSKLNSEPVLTQAASQSITMAPMKIQESKDVLKQSLASQVSQVAIAAPESSTTVQDGKKQFIHSSQIPQEVTNLNIKTAKCIVEYAAKRPVSLIAGNKMISILKTQSSLTVEDALKYADDQLELAHEENLKMTSTLKGLLNERSTYLKKFEFYKDETKRLENALQKLTEAKTNLETQLTKKIKKLEDELRASTEEAKKLTQDLMDIGDRSPGRRSLDTDKKVAELETEISRLRKSDKVLQDYQNEVKSLGKDLEDSRKMVKNLKEDAFKKDLLAKEEKQALTDKLKSYSVEVAELRLKIEDLESKLARSPTKK